MEFSVLFAFLVATCSVHCMRPVIPVPKDAEKTGRYIAVLRQDTSHERLLEMVQLLQNSSAGCAVHCYVEVAIKAIILDLTYDALQKIRYLPEVMYIEEESVSYAASLGSGLEDRLGDLWYLDRIDQLPQEAGDGIDVYILDSGIRFQHEEFGYYRAKYAGYDPVDNYEYNKGTPDYVPMYGVDCHGHGTAVASLVGGEIYGVAKKANLYSVRVLRCDSTAPSGIILDGLNFVTEVIPKRSNNAIVLLALSGSNSKFINDSIEGLAHLGHNVIVITAAGNDGVSACLRSPASSPYAITVGATDRYDNIAEMSNFGSCVDLFAPGVDILTASNQCDSCSDVMSGTTLSAAITAGYVAVYFSQSPYFSSELMRERLLYNAVSGVINFDTIPENIRPETPNLILNRGCGGEISVSVSKRGVLHSPDFPNNYHRNMKCKWTLVAEMDCDSVKINFTHIILEEGHDTLSLCLKDKCSEEEKVVLTGDYYVPDCVLESEGQYMTIEMKTDGFTEGPGFNASHLALFNLPPTYRLNNRCGPHPWSINTTIQLEVFSAGQHVGKRFSIKKDWKEIFGGRMQGINLIVLDEVSGSVIATESCNTHISSRLHSRRLANFIERIPPGRIVCAAVSYDGTGCLEGDAKRAIMSLGSQNIYRLISYQSWALVGYKGAPYGTAIEQISSTAPAEISARVHLKPFREDIVVLSAISAGINSGKYAIIKINNRVIDIPYVGCDRGLHVLVFNEGIGITDKRVFDTSADSGAYSSSEQFVELIEPLTNGTIVVIAIKEEGIDHLSEKAKQACESIGSALIWYVHHGGSWAIIGRKGAAIGSVPESASSSTRDPSMSTYILTSQDADDVTCQIAMRSVNYYGIGSNITVNGVTTYHDNPSTRGHLIALLKNGECSVERKKSFRSSYVLLDFVKSVPPGRTVLVNLARSYLGLTDYGIAVLEGIGSSMTYPYTWTLIGKKGNLKGSAIEYSYYDDEKALGARISLHPIHDTFWLVESDGGDYGRITNNTESFSIPLEYSQALLMVVLKDDFHQERIFNMTASNVSQEVKDFVALVDSLPPGCVVALATNDAGALNQSDEAKEAIEVLGSRYIGESTEGGSWTMIGWKGAPLGSVLEAASNNGPVEIVTHTLPTVTPEAGSCTIFVESASTGGIEGRQLTINGHHINTSLSSGDGLMLAVLKQESCGVDSFAIYAIHNEHAYHDLYRLHSSIVDTPPGRIIVAAVYGTAYPFSSRFSSYYESIREKIELAIESIGSAVFRGVRYRDAWAIIGRKGAVMGSVPEAFSHSVGDQSTAVAVGGNMKLIPSCENELYKLDCMAAIRDL